MKQEELYDFFTHASKAILFLPLVMLIIILMNKQSAYPTKQKPFPSVPLSNTKQSSYSSPTSSLNLQGPLVCQTQTKDASWSASIENKITAGLIIKPKETIHVVVLQDCAYIWGDKKTGEKLCGLSTYIQLADTLMSSGLISTDTLLDSGVIPKTSSLSTSEIRQMIGSCKKQKIEDRRVFEVPKGIKFVEKKK